MTQRLLRKNYFTLIQNSLNTQLFQNFYIKLDEDVIDVMESGQQSCAFFVSSITKLLDLIGDLHGTVDGTVKDLLESGWSEVDEPKTGAILVWEAKDFDGETHKHIGFYMGDEKAISNSYSERVPIEHHWTYGGKRRVQRILWNQNLVDKKIKIA